MELLPTVDLLIGAVLVPGAKAPKLIAAKCCAGCGRAACSWTSPSTRAAARNFAPTTHHDPVFVEEGVTHYCVANMPAAYARTATQALTNVTYRYIEQLADHGLADAASVIPPSSAASM
jgi:alanine dehydrogenase